MFNFSDYITKLHYINEHFFFVDNVLLKIDIPKIPATFTGSGDLFAALFLAHLYLQSNTKITMEKTINSLYSVLLNTYEYSKGINDIYIMRHMYLNIILIQTITYSICRH